MSFDTQDEEIWMKELGANSRANFLCAFIHNLTIVNRLISGDSVIPEEKIDRLRQVNEAIHQASGYLKHCLNSSEEIAWLGVFVARLAQAENLFVQQQIAASWAMSKQERGIGTDLT